MLSTRVNCLLAVLLAPIRGHWACYRFQGTRVGRPAPTRLRRLVVEALRRRAVARARQGGQVRIAANNPMVAACWRAQYPWLGVGVVPAASCRRTAPERADARVALGCEPDEHLALFLGAVRHQKSSECVWQVSSGAGAPGTLLAAGRGMSAPFRLLQLDDRHLAIVAAATRAGEGPRSQDPGDRGRDGGGGSMK